MIFKKIKNHKQIVDEFHKREETKSTLYPSPPNIRGQCGGSFLLSQWLMIQGTRESKILGGSARCFVLVFHVRDKLSSRPISDIYTLF